jgi:hypothetical protein
MPVARSRRQSLHIARVQPEVQAWSQRRCGLLSFRVSTSPTLTTLAPGLGAYALYS